ncbi:trypsin-like serine peptidase [Nocardia sp. NPDC051570]|uniref:trypsin-like serine peptidase n=1 Tax=Nocardia sp. NPDC051570 TaxID=3364324 RepID=UPI0037A4F17B
MDPTIDIPMCYSIIELLQARSLLRNYGRSQTRDLLMYISSRVRRDPNAGGQRRRGAAVRWWQVPLVGAFAVTLLAAGAFDTPATDLAAASAAPTDPASGVPTDPLAFRPNPAVYGQVSSFAGVPVVGALFHTGDSGRLLDHFCTATVVSSPLGNLVITAAHCIGGASRTGNLNIAFAPGYHDNVFPYGIWTATRFMADPQWDAAVDPNIKVGIKGDPNAKGDIDNDFGFLQLASADGSGAAVQNTTGAANIVFGKPTSGVVQVIGYPNSTEEPVICQNALTDSHIPHQLQFNCPGYTDGTSGGPFADPSGEIMGVIGGYQQGGNTPEISYSATFTENTRLLYWTAISESGRDTRLPDKNATTATPPQGRTERR